VNILRLDWIPGLLLALPAYAALLADWQFEDPPGFLNDSSLNDRDLTVVAATVTESATGTPLGQAALISSRGSLSATDQAAWSDASMTVEILFRADSVSSGSTQVLASQWNGTGNQRSWVVGIRSGKIRVLQSAEGSTSTPWDELSVIAGNDYYLGLVAEGGTGTLYLKNLATEDPMTQVTLNGMSSTLFDSTMPLTLGATATPSSPFSGHIGRIRLHDIPLPENELLYEPEPYVPPLPFGYKGL
jgi:hypothetical protein